MLERLLGADPTCIALELAYIESKLLARGTLGMAEELAGDLAPLIHDFLSAPPSHPSGRIRYGNGIAAAATGENPAEQVS